ncbi:MAG: hypothetical protein H0X15_04885 [Acidobacteria bacterium]|jgi:hypothetical protein|nr:hypothetical protein [Acidobacteriota bacterium]MBA4121873.1 hypothetical protein [Acidobacteriota bacterium]MBA4183002.1 hypothetical protein [Acidobacteriota bacterium]
MGLLMMMATIGGLGLAFVLLIISLWTKSFWLTKFVLGAVAVWLVIYAVALIGVSLLSKEKILGLNEPKGFCGFYIDCHMHAAVTDVRKTKTIGDKIAKGEFYIVKVKVFSDARRAALGLHAPKFEVIDALNHKYQRLVELETPVPPFDEKVPAGGAFEKEIVFDLPADVQNPRLDVAEGIGIDKVIESVLIGDEDSILHKRIFFKLEEQPQTVSVK